MLIPDIVLVGYGRTQVYQYKCLKCGSLYFENGKDEFDYLFCEDCRTLHIDKLNKYIKEDNLSDTPFIGNIVGWEIKTNYSNKRSTYNYAKVFKRDNYICQYCQYDIHKAIDFISLTIDHIKPFSAGGNNSMDNLVVACLDCNCLANAKMFTDFDSKRRYILQRRLDKKLFVSDALIGLYDLKK